MTELHAKPIIDNKFWIVEQDGEKVATLRKNEDNRFVMSNEEGIKIYDTKESLTKEFGKNFLQLKLLKNLKNAYLMKYTDIQLALLHTMPCLTFEKNFRCLLKVMIQKVYTVQDTTQSNLKKVGSKVFVLKRLHLNDILTKVRLKQS
jgi:hypothetical protein